MLVDFRLRFEVSAWDLLVLASGAAVALLLRLRSREEEYRGLVAALQGQADPRLEEAWRSAARLHTAVEEAERRFRRARASVRRQQRTGNLVSSEESAWSCRSWPASGLQPVRGIVVVGSSSAAVEAAPEQDGDPLPVTPATSPDSGSEERLRHYEEVVGVRERNEATTDVVTGAVHALSSLHRDQYVRDSGVGLGVGGSGGSGVCERPLERLLARRGLPARSSEIDGPGSAGPGSVRSAEI